MLALDDLPALALFARVVQSQSFAAAAKHEGLAKSAVSQRIARLEGRLGMQLLRRSTRKLSLTEDGQRLYEHAATLLAVSEAADKSLQGGRGAGVSGPLRVNAPAGFTRARLVDALRSFVEAYPEVTPRLTLEPRLIDLVEAHYDVVLRLTPIGAQTYAARRLATSRLTVAASPRYFARMGRPERPEDLVRHHCLHNSSRALRDDWRFSRAGRWHAVPVVPTFETNDTLVLREAAIAGLGLFVIPSLLIADALEAGLLEGSLEAFLPLELGLFAIAPAAKFKTPAARAFVDHLARFFARKPPSPAGAAPKARGAAARRA